MIDKNAHHICKWCEQSIYIDSASGYWAHNRPPIGRSAIYCEPDMQSMTAEPLDTTPQQEYATPMRSDLIDLDTAPEIPAHLLDRSRARKAATDHTITHPHLGCADVGCTRSHEDDETSLVSTERAGYMLANSAFDAVVAENVRLRQALQDAGVPAGLVDAIAKGTS
jgi:hypothetical protein